MLFDGKDGFLHNRSTSPFIILACNLNKSLFYKELIYNNKRLVYTCLHTP